MEKIILKIRRQHNKPLSFFLNGGCLVFAKELQSTIGGSLRYLKQEAHVILEKGGKLYDASGNVTSTYKNSPYLSERELYARPKIILSLLSKA